MRRTAPARVLAADGLLHPSSTVTTLTGHTRRRRVRVRNMLDSRKKMASLPNLGHLSREGIPKRTLRELEKRMASKRTMSASSRTEVTAEDLRTFELRPRQLRFGFLKQGSVYRRSFQLIHVGLEPARFRIMPFDRAPDDDTKLRVLHTPRKIAPGMRLKVEVELSAGGVDSVADEVHIVTETQVFKLPVTATILDETEFESRSRLARLASRSIMSKGTRLIGSIAALTAAAAAARAIRSPKGAAAAAASSPTSAGKTMPTAGEGRESPSSTRKMLAAMIVPVDGLWPPLLPDEDVDEEDRAEMMDIPKMPNTYWDRDAQQLVIQEPFFAYEVDEAVDLTEIKRRAAIREAGGPVAATTMMDTLSAEGTLLPTAGSASGTPRSSSAAIDVFAPVTEARPTSRRRRGAAPAAKLKAFASARSATARWTSAMRKKGGAASSIASAGPSSPSSIASPPPPPSIASSGRRPLSP
eukprot:PLAT11565.2.p1 GENE.PLAT11565.2~~PLAT11565.2.p1  ORF type:complete len:470 (-),score=179.58 PLAT11565.2:51-1460(-)